MTDLLFWIFLIGLGLALNGPASSFCWFATANTPTPRRRSSACSRTKCVTISNSRPKWCAYESGIVRECNGPGASSHARTPGSYFACDWALHPCNLGTLLPCEGRMKSDNHEELHAYEYSGIQERRGKVPMWLMLVYLSLGIWAIYYLWAYWSHY